MNIIGQTTSNYIYVFSKDTLKVDSYLKVMDESNNFPIGIIVENYRFKNIEDCHLKIKQSLKSVMLNGIDDFTIVKLKILDELSIPLKPEANVEFPDFNEVQKYLIYGDVDKHLMLGIIRGSSDSIRDIPDKYKDLFNVYNKESGLLEMQKDIPMIYNHYKLKEYPHLGFFGGSGSGKTHAIRVTFEELMNKRISGVMLDPHFELDFKETSKDIDSKFKKDFSNNHKILVVGQDIGIDFTELNSTEIATLLQFLSNIPQPTLNIINAVHEKGETFSSFINKLEKLKEAFDYNELNYNQKKDSEDELDTETVIIYEKYKKSVSGSTSLQALLWRVNQLKRIGIFNNNIDKVKQTILDRKIAVIRGRDIHVKMISEYLFTKMYSLRRAYKDYKKDLESNYVPEKFPPFVIGIDEAHNYAPNHGFSPLKKTIVEIAQEARKYGVFLILGTQRPALLDDTVFAQLNTKFIFRITSRNDMETIKMETNLSDNQFRRLPNLATGNAFVASPILNQTTAIRFRANITISTHELNPFEELEDFEVNDKLERILKNHLPLLKKDINGVISTIEDEFKKSLSLAKITETLEAMVKSGKIKKEKSIFEQKYFL